MMTRNQTWNALAVAAALLGSACSVDESPQLADHADEIDRAVSSRPQDATTPQPLVVISGADSRIEWLAAELPGEEPEIVITVNGLATPLILPDLVERVGAVQAYLALVAESQPLHAALLPYVSEEDRAVMNDPEQRRALRAENQRLLSEFERELAAAGDQPGTAAGCSLAQRSHAQGIYGAAYSAGAGSLGTKTCGQNIAGFNSEDGNSLYCNIPGGDCDYELGGGAECDPEGCTTVRGRTRALRARWQVNAGGGNAFQHYGRRYRFGFKNCSGTDSATMARRRGGGAWINTPIGPNQMAVRTGGATYPPEIALARTFVAWGLWEEHHDWGTIADPLNQMDMTVQTDGLMCGDIIQRFDTFDQPTGWCNNGAPLCDDNTCSPDGCWD
jgi:hypothetical protein